MITILAYGMIIAFLYLLTKKKLNVFAALILVPIVFGLAACMITGKDPILIFDWIKKGLFFSQNPTTHKVRMGVMSGLALILFAILYFGIMLKSGLFDPLCIFFIKMAKGDGWKLKAQASGDIYQAKARAEQYLTQLGLWDKRDVPSRSLSGGMKRRVALARAIALDPQILMYDEPFVGQDPIAMGVLVRLIRLLNDALGITSIVVSHDLAETASIADYLYVVGDSQVLGHGTPDELMNSANPRIRQFMQGIPDGPVPFHFPAPDYRDQLLGGDDA